MVDHHEAQLALRTKLLALSVATTGSTSISATATGYARAAGSFITDGFRVGMEVAGSGFSVSANNTAKTVTAVATLTLTAAGCAVESVGTRTLTVGLPAGREWENTAYTPTDGSPWVEEQYMPGPMTRITAAGGAGSAVLEVLPQYAPRVYVPAGKGVDAGRMYADALLTLFAPNTPFVLSSGTLRVRGDVAPYSGQMLQAAPGFAVVPVTVPLRLRTTNSI